MWTHEASIETSAAPDRIWELFADVPGWARWNVGIERTELNGAFARGTTFLMQPPGEDAFLSTLIDVTEPQGFTDETIIDGTRVLVQHRIEPIAPGRTRIVYRTQITGPSAAEFGPLVTSDFGQVLVALKQHAEAN